MGIGGWEGNYISLKHTELSMSGLPRKSKTWENHKDGVPQVQKSRDTMRSFRNVYGEEEADRTLEQGDLLLERVEFQFYKMFTRVLLKNGGDGNQGDHPVFG